VYLHHGGGKCGTGEEGRISKKGASKTEGKRGNLGNGQDLCALGGKWVSLRKNRGGSFTKVREVGVNLLIPPRKSGGGRVGEPEGS